MLQSENPTLAQKTFHVVSQSLTKAPPWFISLMVHLVLLVCMALVTFEEVQKIDSFQITAPAVLPTEEFEILPEFVSSDLPASEIGGDSFNGTGIAEALAMHTSTINDIPPPTYLPDFGEAFSEPLREIPTANVLSQLVTVKGAAGMGATGASGAIDRITHEVIRSLEQREVLLVWMFDRSASMQPQRLEVLERMERVYKELGVLEQGGSEAFTRHQDKPVLSSVIAFGERTDVLIPKPTDDLEQVRQAIRSVKIDESGLENVFGAVNVALDRFKQYRIREPRRNVMLIVFTDEVGSDQHLVDQTVTKCRNLEVPVYVVGVPSPFGRATTEIKYVHPDPRYDDIVQWAIVDQGPETLHPEAVRLTSPGGQNDAPIDSGFGPFSLTRLCLESGGIYFAVHPNRDSQRPGQETALMASRLQRFFKPEVMERYRPEYLSVREINRQITANKTKQALVTAARMSAVGITSLESPQLTFPRLNDAQLVNSLTEGQKAAALLEPRLNQLFEVLRQGERDREKLTEIRWRAGYDLAMGRVLAAKVRTEGYNLMLARAKQGMRFQNPKNDTWRLRPADTISVGSVLERQAALAKQYLQRVVDEHPNTPWAYYAQRELASDLGWTWEESFTGVVERQMAANQNNAAPQDDQANMLRRRPTPPPPPRL